MKHVQKDYALRLMVLLVLVMTFGLLVLGVQKRSIRKGEPLELPASDEVTVCYYIPDVGSPYEQVWLGGDKLEEALSELAGVVFYPADEPDGGKMVSCLVIATNEEQITVHVDEDGACWVWMEIKGWMKGEDHETQKD